MGFFDRRKEKKRLENDQKRLADMDEDEFWDNIEMMEKGPDVVEAWKKDDQNKDVEEIQSFDPFSSEGRKNYPVIKPYFEGDGAFPFGRGPRYVPTMKDMLRFLKRLSDECQYVEATKSYKIFFDRQIKNRLKQPELVDSLCAGEVMMVEIISIKPLPESKLGIHQNVVRNETVQRAVDRLVLLGYVDDSDPNLSLAKYKLDELKDLMAESGIDNLKGKKADLIERFCTMNPKAAKDAASKKGRIFSITPKGEELLERFPYFRKSYEGDVVHYLDAYQLNLLMNEQPNRPLIEAIDEMYSRLAFGLLGNKTGLLTYYPEVLDCLVRLWAQFDPDKACRIAMHMYAFKCRSDKMKPRQDPTMVYLLENTMNTFDEIAEIMEDELKYTKTLSAYPESVIPALRQAFRDWPNRR